MRSQMVDVDWHVRMCDNWTLSNLFNARSRSLFVGIQCPHQIVRVLAFVPFFNSKRLQYDQRQHISNSRDYRFLDAAMI